MAITPVSYNPPFWSSVPFRGLDLFAGTAIENPRTVAQLLVEYFRHVIEPPTHFSFQVVGGRERKLKTKTVTKILETLEPVEGNLQKMFVEAVRDNDHTHAVASLSYSYSTIGRQNMMFGAHCFQEDFDLSLACHLARRVAENIHLDYGFSTCRKGLMEASSFGCGLRVLSDPFSAKRERWMGRFQLADPRPSDAPFLGVFELNVLSDLHLSSSVAGRSFESFVLQKGLGTMEKIGKGNFLWLLGQKEIGIAQKELSNSGLVAMA